MDDIAPVLECVPAVTLSLDENGADTLRNRDIRISEMDNCTMNPIGPRVVGGRTQRYFDCEDAGLDFERLFFVRDSAGNSSDTCTVIVTILDEIAPVVT